MRPRNCICNKVYQSCDVNICTRNERNGIYLDCRPRLKTVGVWRQCGRNVWALKYWNPAAILKKLHVIGWVICFSSVPAGLSVLVNLLKISRRENISCGFQIILKKGILHSFYFLLQFFANRQLYDCSFRQRKNTSERLTIRFNIIANNDDSGSTYSSIYHILCVRLTANDSKY